MAETLALAKLSWNRNRWYATNLLAVLLVALLAMVIVSVMEFSDFVQNCALIVTLFVLMATGFASLVLFDYSNEGNLSDIESGCNHWVLRMPIAPWKIAVVPIAMKTLWIIGCWTVCLGIMHHAEVQDRIPLIAPPVFFSGLCTWILVFSWRPFRYGWARLVVVAIAGTILTLGLGAVFKVSSIETRHVQWKSFAEISAVVLSFAMFLVAIRFAIHGVRLARTNAMGIIPQEKSQDLAIFQGRDRERQFGNATSAIMFFDFLASRFWLRKVFFAVVIPSICIFVFWVPPGLGSLILVLIVFGYLAVVAVPQKGGVPNSLPPHLAASPISDTRLAWSRMITALVIATVTFLFVLLVFAGWACWEEGREAWLQWSKQRANEAGSTAVIQIGLRWSIAILIATLTFVLSRLSASYWVEMTGRPWVAIANLFAISLIIVISAGLGIRWFLQQTDWETTRQQAFELLEWAPSIATTLLLIKGISVTASAWTLHWRQIASLPTIACAIAGWIAIVSLVSVTLLVLIPDPRFTWSVCLASVTLVIPLARVLIVPFAVALNRHR
ncbi:MAG: hypothetical protein AB8B91_18170 [Rubripirellula sp.]